MTCAGGYVQLLSLNMNNLNGSIPPELGNLTSLWYLRLSSNQLSGSIPAELENLTNLRNDDGLNLSWNALHSEKAALVAFLDARQEGGDWQSTQTIAPENLAADWVGAQSAGLSWDAISYVSDPGRYEVLQSLSSGGPYSTAGQTAGKTISSHELSMLTPGTTYFVVVRTVTEPHPNNQNTVVSEVSAELDIVTLQQQAVHVPGLDSLGRVMFVLLLAVAGFMAVRRRII